ncbi:uncharacterized protein B0H64DRAFT_190751 [Chaetomium fimeti]|uniref:Uncharacterized protein n=1 Tax=Chaetomium fimeti TaxID=1854472 RepID=A0AAE0LRA3_9PEZI|nr:hypothetical protein B0H64DRAFT_190751 [Chaetomium fimeti]
MKDVLVQKPEAIKVTKTQAVGDECFSPSANTKELPFFKTVGGLKPSHRRRSCGDLISSTSTYLNKLRDTVFIPALSIYSFAQSQLTKRAATVTKFAGLAGFAIACVALWSTLSAMEDGRRALALAQWTARKDFLGYCQSVNYTAAGCEKATKTSLSPPPIFVASDTPVITILGCTDVSFGLPVKDHAQIPTAGLYGIIEFADLLPPPLPIA